MKSYTITPVPKPRQTRSDVWRKRPCVMRYRAFADEVRRQGIAINSHGDYITFVLPMPKSWSQKKKYSMLGQPHQVRGDIDNYAKALFDSIFKDDSHIWDIRLKKIWGVSGMILIENM